ncbi:pyrimidine reductase family protein [Catellatospora sp. KI3]|uniref:pyrimidine reductase family protein n=1 Tax=Catellatospora sp. KI3 TaxID=3041620 RepID=UPI00248260FC|nr:pyrimidine reductase family protein [Catellatospora sp. KI3]MDI1461975.1 pyrimidine reductase family protein [Catellatospora sp. KI3]
MRGGGARVRSAAEVSDGELAAWYGRADRPWLRANFVASADGAVAVGGMSTGLSGAQDRRLLKLLRMLCDGLLVGANTLRVEQYRPLTLDADRRRWREERGLAAYPRLVVVSGSLDLDPDLPALAQAPVRPLVLTSPDAPTARRDRLAGVADVVAAPDLRAGLALLRTRGLDQLLCEGGPSLLGSLTADDLVDELCLTVSPLLAGAGAGRITAGAPHPPRTLAHVHTHTDPEGFLYLRHTRPEAPTS